MIKTSFLFNFKIEWIPYDQKQIFFSIATIFHLTVLVWKKEVKNHENIHFCWMQSKQETK